MSVPKRVKKAANAFLAAQQKISKQLNNIDAEIAEMNKLIDQLAAQVFHMKGFNVLPAPRGASRGKRSELKKAQPNAPTSPKGRPHARSGKSVRRSRSG